MVKPLLDEYPISMVSRSLGLGHSQLKQNVIEQSVSFVEAVSCTTSEVETHQPPVENNHVQRCDIVLKRPCGSVLKINEQMWTKIPLTLHQATCSHGPFVWI